MGCDWWISILVCLACRKTMSGDVFRMITIMHNHNTESRCKTYRSFSQDVSLSLPIEGYLRVSHKHLFGVEAPLNWPRHFHDPSQ